jgi:hypothetical protein
MSPAAGRSRQASRRPRPQQAEEASTGCQTGLSGRQPSVPSGVSLRILPTLPDACADAVILPTAMGLRRGRV